MTDEITVDITLSTERFARIGASLGPATLAGLGLLPGMRRLVEAAERAAGEFARHERNINAMITKASTAPITRLQWFAVRPPRLVTSRRRRVATQMRRTQRRAERRARRSEEAWAKLERCPIESRVCSAPLLAASIDGPVGGQCEGCGWRFGMWA